MDSTGWEVEVILILAFDALEFHNAGDVAWHEHVTLPKYTALCL